VMDDVHRACAGRSMLLITHRPEGLDRVDAVLRLTHGRIEPDTTLPLDRLTASREERA
jgi:ABC-type transport system involved in cytochrome bd biosynthesis fused ATPase/permease subunit